MVHCVLDWNYIWFKTKTLGCKGGYDKMAQGARHGSMGPEQNEL